jgi:hypothetical protein
MSTNIRPLIDEYIRAADTAVQELRAAYSSADLLKSRRNGLIPKCGLLRDGTAFSFHGVGCRFETDVGIVDVDFGPEGRVGGFDAWRLQRFAESHPDYRALSLEDLERAIKELRCSGKVVQPRLAPSAHLYYLSEEGEQEASGR